ncbi:hypothetical protein BBO_06800 [Beauveria brongniartii RCEF 3172]|uniref:Uncharacterized protein n=1 Tax=Beauveria brongniartii RCEF 3172 TaxID=1081107 RepID=A0A167AII3_9HYPO|nr:hypothetical protein BBO_06800 [Beauveria brongniartii RCEF 3172]
MSKSTADVHSETRKRSHIDTDTGNEHDSEMQARKMTLHMENQERAYVAASRRTDRSLEARYQSALMASQVHKRRTGKTLRVTHQIVRDEEMYEEEDQGLPSPSRFSQNGDRRRTLSQTDAYIAALIARKSGMQNFFEHNHALFTSPPNNNATWKEPPPSTRAYHCCAAPLANQPIGCEIPSKDPAATLSKRNSTNATPNLYEESGHFPGGIISHAHTSSSGSSLSDLSSYDSNYIFGSSSNERNSSPESSDLRLEDCLVGTDGEDLVNFAPDELLVGYDSQFNTM